METDRIDSVVQGLGSEVSGIWIRTPDVAYRIQYDRNIANIQPGSPIVIYGDLTMIKGNGKLSVIGNELYWFIETEELSKWRQRLKKPTLLEKPLDLSDLCISN